jgi:hypothetical protein
MTLFKVTIAGIDVTKYVNEKTIHLTNNLGQGPGIQQNSSGRAATAEFDTTLGPAASAMGAGEYISGPSLARLGEVQIFDFLGTLVFSGYAGVHDDVTTRTSVFTHVQCYDYWQELDRIVVTEVYNGVSDTYIIKDLLTKYASWLDRSLISSTNNYVFQSQVFLHVYLRDALQAVTDTAGQVIWITPDKKVHYIPLSGASSAAYEISDAPNKVTSFPATITKYQVDDTAAVNRVFFYGGNYLSGNFTQDISTQANGSNTLFQIAYYPYETTDGYVIVKVNGSSLAVAFTGADQSLAANVLKPAGTADCLINRSSHTIQFAYAPASGATVTCEYRYQLPLTVVLTSQASYGYYGRYLDTVYTDTTVIETSQAIQQSRVLLSEQAYGLTTLEMDVWQPGLVPGTVITVNNTVRNIHGNFMIQSVEGMYQGGGYNGTIKYHVVCGAWHWNVIDILMSMLQGGLPLDTNIDGEGSPIQVPDVPGDTVTITFTATAATRTQGGYYPRSTPVGDGHDAYPGLASV